MQTFEVAGGWAPMQIESEARCNNRLDITKMYLPAKVGDVEFIVDCVYAASRLDAVAIVKE